MSELRETLLYCIHQSDMDDAYGRGIARSLLELAKKGEGNRIGIVLNTIRERAIEEIQARKDDPDWEQSLIFGAIIVGVDRLNSLGLETFLQDNPQVLGQKENEDD